MEISHLYDDIIDLPHHVSAKHPQMSMLHRAAQFSPFAALTGYDDAIAETARLTDAKAELDEDRMTQINEQLSALRQQESARPPVTVVYFQPDPRKAGGAYRTVTGRVKKVDEYHMMLVLTDGTVIPFDDIYSIEEAGE